MKISQRFYRIGKDSWRNDREKFVRRVRLIDRTILILTNLAYVTVFICYLGFEY